MVRKTVLDLWMAGLAAGVVAGCSAGICKPIGSTTTMSAAKPSTYQAVPLIPRQVLFGNPERVSPRLSPDGRYLAYLAPDDRDVLQVWLRTRGQEDDRVLTHDQKRGIRMFFWTYDGRQLIYMQDADGDENWRLYAVNVETNEVRDLTPFDNVQARVVELDPAFPDQMLVGLNRRDPRVHDVYRMNLESGELELEAENPGNIVSWQADAQFHIRAATAARPDGGWDLMFRPSVDAPWQTIRQWSPQEQGGPVMFSPDGQTLYVMGNDNANAIRLVALDPATGRQSVVVEDPRYDLTALFVHPLERKIQAAGFTRAKLEWQVLDPEVRDDFDAIRKIRDGQFQIVSRSLDDRFWIVAFEEDDGPVYYYLYHRPDRSHELMFTNRPDLENWQLAGMKPIEYQARDGLTIHGYLTVPPKAEPKNLPAVLDVHGGPWARDTWGYNPMAQWLANRGYAVLQVNFRGSSGYGKEFLNAGNREWGAKMQDDLTDAARWLVDQGIADSNRIGIMGGSYGGYATLAALTFTPDVFTCGVSIVGPSNLITLIQTIPPYWEPLKATFKVRVGDLETEEEFLKSRSPLFFVDRIRSPLLIAQGANDPRVKQAESEQIVEAMRQAGKPVTYALYTDEGHGLARPENRLHFYAVAEQFLAQYLGGRYEEGGEIEGHSGKVERY